MISEHVVSLAIDYLDQCAAADRTATLVGMHSYIDGRNKTLPLMDEINEALKRRPSVGVNREDGSVVFSRSGTAHAVTHEDMKRADTLYRKEFSAALEKLRT